MSGAKLPSGASVVGSLTLPAALASVPAARKFAVGCLVESVSEAGDEVRDAVALLTAELVTNAVLHALSPVIVTVAELPDLAVRVAVHDEDRHVPAVHDHGDEAATGRGMRLVDAISRSWGVDLDEAGAPAEGKTVWFEVPLQQTAEDSDAALAAQFADAQFTDLTLDGD